MRAFKIWNKNRTSSFNLSGLNVITTNVAGLGNKFTNELYDGRIKKHLIRQTNSFEQINLTVNFGVHSNAYQKYREFMNFIQANGRNILVIEYYTPGASRFVDVVLSGSTKNQKTNFNVLVETVTFDRLTPYYILQRRTGRSVLVSNRYLENVAPRIELKNNLYPTGTKIRVKSKNIAKPNLTGKEYLGGGVYLLFKDSQGGELKYNTQTSIITANGIFSTTVIEFIKLTGVELGQYNFNIIKLSGSITGWGDMIRYNWYIPGLKQIASGGSAYDKLNISVSYPYLNLQMGDLSTPVNYTNFTFMLQLEKAGNNIELDRPIDELNGYTLREVFEDGNIHKDIPNVITNDPNLDVMKAPNSRFYVNMNYELVSRGSYVGWYLTKSGQDNIPYYNNDFIGIKNEILDMANRNRDSIRWLFTGVYEIKVNYSYVINLTLLGISHLTVEQMNYYFNQYQTLKETPTEYTIPTTTTQEIELNETILTNQELIIDSENKTVTLNGANAYQITNKDKTTFLNLPEGDYIVECDTPITVEYKRWVID